MHMSRERERESTHPTQPTHPPTLLPDIVGRLLATGGDPGLELEGKIDIPLVQPEIPAHLATHLVDGDSEPACIWERRYVGGWVRGWVEEEKAVQMSYCGSWIEVGGVYSSAFEPPFLALSVYI